MLRMCYEQNTHTQDYKETPSELDRYNFARRSV